MKKGRKQHLCVADAAHKNVSRNMIRFQQSITNVEEYVCEFFNSLGLLEHFQDQPNTGASSSSKPATQLLADNIKHLINLERLFERDVQFRRVIKCKCSKQLLEPGTEEAYAAKYCAIGYYHIHKDCRCLYFKMMASAAQTVGNYYQEYLEIPASTIARSQPGVHLGKCPRLCKYHIEAIEYYRYTSAIVSIFMYTYVTQLNRVYNEAMIEIMSSKFVAITYECDTTANQRLAVMSITTSERTYIINFVEAQVYYLPRKIAMMLQSSELAKIVENECSFSEYFKKTYKLEVVNVVGILQEDMIVRNNLSIADLPIEKSNHTEHVAEKIDTNPNVKINVQRQWYVGPIAKLDIIAAAKICFYMYKHCCCMQLAHVFMSEEFTKQVKKEQDMILS